MKKISKFDNYEDENFEDAEFDENEKLRNRKKGKTLIVISVIIFLVLAFVFSFYYYDTHYGKGIIKGYVSGKGTEKQTLFNSSDDSKTTDTEEAKNDTDGNLAALQKDTEKEEPKEEISSKNPTMGKELLKFDEGNVLTVKTLKDSYFVCSKDGVKFFDGNDKQIFNDTYTMNYPIIVSEGGFVAVYEVLGVNIRVYNEKGLLYTVACELPVSKVKLNKNGYISVIMNGQSACKTAVYNNAGKILLERTENTSGVYPTDLDISDDNTVLCVSYLDTSDVSTVSKILFFYINKEDSLDYTDGMFAASEKSDSYAVSVNCMENNTFFVTTDISLICFSSSGEELWLKEVLQRISAYDVSGKAYAVIGYDGTIPESGEGKYSSEVVNLSGKTVSAISYEDPISFIKSDSKNYIVKTGSIVCGYNKSGKEQFKTIPPYEVRDISLFEGKTNGIVVSGSFAEKADLTNGKFAKK